jgi:hypothetical protein
MELLDFPEEILMEILSKLDQRNNHLTAALVCKRFLQLTRSPQLLKCVKYQGEDLGLNRVPKTELFPLKI